jgi:hypothetical protein
MKLKKRSSGKGWLFDDPHKVEISEEPLTTALVMLLQPSGGLGGSQKHLSEITVFSITTTPLPLFYMHGRSVMCFKNLVVIMSI